MKQKDLGLQSRYETHRVTGGKDLNKVIIYTQAYNASRTLQRTIDSVLAQTYKDWIWLIIDNGSQDDTSNIIMHAAVADCRIIPYCMKENDVRIITKFCLKMKEIFPEDCFMSLDADDMIHPEYMEKLLKFMDKHNLDIAACGTEFARGSAPETSDVTKVRSLQKNLVMESKDYGNEFVTYKPFINEFWAKIYKFSVITEEAFHILSGFSCDSQIVLNFLRNSKKMGILAEPLHRAYLSDHSLTNSLRGFREENAGANKMVLTYSTSENGRNVNQTYLGYKRYLKAYGEISDENADYLASIYIGWIHEKLILLCLLYSREPKETLYREFLDILHSQVFHEVFTAKAHLLKYRNLSMRKSILLQLKNFIQFLKNDENEIFFSPVLRKEIEILLCEIPETSKENDGKSRSSCGIKRRKSPRAHSDGGVL